MKTTFNLRLPEELCEKIEREAKKNHLSINQYILYSLTKTVAYNEAMEMLNTRLSNVPDLTVEEILSKIPGREPLVRVIEIEENASLYDFHDAIQDAVSFGRDHPFAFFIANSWRGKRQWLTDEEKWEGMEHNFSTIKLKGPNPDQYPGFED